MEFKLHYGEINSINDVKCFEFNNKFGLLNYISELHKNTYITKFNFVCLMLIDDDILVTDSLTSILNFVNSNLGDLPMLTEDVFMYEFGSYEKAYEMALMLKEISPLCYEKTKENGKN